MAEDSHSPPLSRRVPGAARSGPGPSARRVLPESMLARMQAAVDAAQARAAAEAAQAAAQDPERRGPGQLGPEPITEPLPRLQAAVAAAEAKEHKRADRERGTVQLPRLGRPRAPTGNPPSPAVNGIGVRPDRVVEPDWAVVLPDRVGRPASKRPPAAAESVTPDWWVPQTAQRTPPAGWRYRVAGLAAAIVLVLAGSLAIVLSWRSAAPPAGEGRAAATRELAAAWVARQVSRDAVVLCDRVTCTALEGRGFPSSNLRVLGRALPRPLSYAVVVVTAVVRDQYGSSLSSRLAPTDIASFGSGTLRIDIRAMAPHGTAGYEGALNADLLLRKTAGSGLLGSRQIVASATARRQLAAGQVDSRLLLVITALAAQNPIDIVGFGSVAPRASPGTPLRFVDLAETDPATHRRSASYVRSMVALLRVQNPPYRPAHVLTLRLADGIAILRIDFGAPSPLGLLSPQNP